MSFYGDIKRINSSPYVFDRYYGNRAEMDNNASSDGIYVGRYVLVKYTYSPHYVPVALTSSSYLPNTYYYKNIREEYVLDTSSTFTTGREYFVYSAYSEKYNKDENTYAEITLTEDTYKKNYYYIFNGGNYQLATGDFSPTTQYFVLLQHLSDTYAANAQIDLERYQDTYDATVWQKIYSKVTDESDLNKEVAEEKYILIAELNASIPRMEFKSTSPKYSTGYDTEHNPIEFWNKPEIYPNAASEDAYTVLMPDILHLDVGDMGDDFYGKQLIDNPAEKRSYQDIDTTSPPPNSGIPINDWETFSEEKKKHILALSSKYNFMEWTNMFQGSPATVPGEIDSKRLDTRLYAFGQLISDLYDVLYGAPANGEDGLRPFYTSDLSEIINNYDKGLIGILTSIATEAKGDIAEDLYGRKIQNGLYYYFISKWGDATEDPDNFIENIPEVVGASSVKGGSAARSQLYINFNKNESPYIQRFS